MNSRHRAARLAFALFVITTGVNLQAPLYAAMARQDGVGLTATTVAFSFYVAGIVPVLLLLGGLSDHIGRRPVIWMSLTLSGASTLLMLISPHIVTLGAARWLLGVGTALMSAAAPAYMADILDVDHPGSSASWVTASTSLGFGLGPALTGLFLFIDDSLRPPSLWLHLAGTIVSAALLSKLPKCNVRRQGSLVLGLPYYPAGAWWFGGAILLAWATTGLIISILPAVLARVGLTQWSGVATLCAISCGLAFQPAARRLSPTRSTRTGLILLPPAYALLSWGALQGNVALVLVGALVASSACYGFIYLGGLSGVAALAGARKARASSGFFLMAYVGFSVPVVFTGILADNFGLEMALGTFGVLLAAGVGLMLMRPGENSPTSNG
ncbi:MFS transporter [Verminephrobacter eiseniae]|nr:MFS transporter [Verminephrobacter eiseniae]MCW5287183.1 MFS transporter [Verminephrobacter eiseniae]MCW5305482.1 MFS transporter [Verminephrobacter eiseniae]MCW8179542.1 MFS transporter [Verminephrobacter eiseniae]MCW8189373.1 MFS transporter [Verminephrobacter eiseniae]